MTGPALHATHVAVPKRTAGRMMGVRAATVDELARLGVMRSWTRPGGKRKLAIIHPVTLLDGVYREWRETHGAVTTPHDLQLYSDARELCKIDRDEEHPLDVLKAVGGVLSEIGVLNEAEARAWLPTLPDDWHSIQEAIRPHFRSALTTRWAAAAGDVPEVDASLAASVLPEDLRSLPRTSLDPFRGHEYEPPARNVLNNAVKLTRKIEAAVLYAFISARSSRRWQTQATILFYLRKFTEILEAAWGETVWEPARLDEACRWLLSDAGAELSGESNYSRLYMVRAWGWFTSTLARYSRELEDEKRSIFLRHIPNAFKPSAELSEAMTRIASASSAERKEWRKTRTRRVRVNLDEILASVDNRAYCARVLTEAALEAIKQLGDGRDHQDFEVLLPNLDRRGLHGGDWHVQHMRVWKDAAAWESLGWRETSYATREAIRRRRSRQEDDGPVIELLAMDGHTGAEPSECWLFECARNFTQASIASLPVETRLKRIETLSKYGLPTVRETFSGLLKFSDTRATLARNASLLGRSFVPLLEICHAVRLAALLVTIGAQTQARLDEILQLRVDRWARDDMIPGQAHYSQEVIPKVPSHTPLEDVEPKLLVVDRATMDEILDLHDLELFRTGRDRFPTVEADFLRAWKVEPGPLTFSHSGRRLPDLFTMTCLAYALAGWERFTIHDLRHALNEEAQFEGVPDWIRAARLGHSGLFALVTYDTDEKEAKKTASAASIERRLGRLEDGA